MVIGWQTGSLTTAVVPGSVPCLIFLEVMKKMNMVHTAENVVQVVVNGQKEKLCTKFTPKGQLAVNLWSGLKRPQNCKFALVASESKAPEKPTEPPPIDHVQGRTSRNEGTSGYCS